MAMGWNETEQERIKSDTKAGRKMKMIYGAVDVQNALIMTALALVAGAVIYVKRHWKEMISGKKAGKDGKETRELKGRAM